MKFHRFSLCVDDQTYNAIQTRVKASGDSMADVTRQLLKKALASDWVDENADLIANVVREQLDIVLKPHVERLAAISSKSGHMSAAAAFLNAQALQDLVPKDQRRDVKEMFDKARKKSAEFMRLRTEDWGEKASKGGDNY